MMGNFSTFMPLPSMCWSGQFLCLFKDLFQCFLGIVQNESSIPVLVQVGCRVWNSSG